MGMNRGFSSMTFSVVAVFIGVLGAFLPACGTSTGATGTGTSAPSSCGISLAWGSLDGDPSVCQRRLDESCCAEAKACADLPDCKQSMDCENACPQPRQISCT